MQVKFAGILKVNPSRAIGPKLGHPPQALDIVIVTAVELVASIGAVVTVTPGTVSKAKLDRQHKINAKVTAD